MLEDDAERNARVATEGDDTIGFFSVTGDGLFHQNVFAGFRELSDDIDAGIWRRRDDSEIDIRIARCIFNRRINRNFISGVFRRFGSQCLGAPGTAIDDTLQTNFSELAAQASTCVFATIPAPTMTQVLIFCISGASFPMRDQLHTGMPVVNRLVFRYTGYENAGGYMPKIPVTGGTVPTMERLDLNRPVVDQIYAALKSAILSREFFPARRSRKTRLGNPSVPAGRRCARRSAG